MRLKKITKHDLLKELEDIGYDFYDNSLNDTNWSSVYEMAVNEDYEYIEKYDYWVNKNQAELTYN